MPKRRQIRGFDLKQIQGVDHLIGVDEAGRGALAGPVVAAAVVVTRDFLEGRWAQYHAGEVNDSKQLTAETRERLWREFEALAARGELHANYGVADVGEIAQFNILGATKLAMRRALEGMYAPAAFAPQLEPDLFTDAATAAAYRPAVSARIIIDGLTLRHFPYPHTGVVRGDVRSLCIAMASIIAKVTRDRLMDGLHGQFPAYGFDRHKGYGTEDHREALLRLGRCPQHRDVFLRKLFAQRVDPAQMDFPGADWVDGAE